MTNGTTIEKARLYEQYRLPYALDLVDDLLAHIDNIASVADVGAGTGQLARLFAPRCQQVFAIEPDAAMRTVAAEPLRAYSNITLIDASAENTTLPANSVDLIVIGNAFHRFRADAIDELRRILKPSGWAAVVSYIFTDQAFAHMLFPRLRQLESFAARSAQTWHRLPVTALFGERETHTLRYAQSVAEDWQAFWGSAQSGIEAPEPGDPEFAPFETINREVFDAFSNDGVIRIAYETSVVFGQPNA